MKYQKTVLKNGIRVVTEHHSSSRAASVGAWILTGTRDEKENEMGISHFLEHLVFKGTKTRSAYQIAKSLEALGGELNAYTTREYTNYHCLVLKDHWKTGLEVICDLIANMKLKNKDFILEKSVILQEIAMTEDSLEELIFDRYLEKAYPHNSVGYSILGNENSITGLTQKKVSDYYKNNYSGRNIIISASGNISHSELVESVERFLKKKSKGKKLDERLRPQHKTFRLVEDRPSEQLHLMMGMPLPGFKDKYRYEAFILNALIGGGMTSRLFQSVRERRGLVYTINSSVNNFMDAGLMLVYAATEEKHVQKLVEIVSQELRKIKKNGLKQSDVDLYKTQVIGNILLGSDDTESRMVSLGINEMVFGRYRPIEEVIADIQNVDRKSINQFIKDYFDLDKIGGIIMGGEASKFANWWKEFKF